MIHPASDPYANKALLGAMVRDAAKKASVHYADAPDDVDIDRINNITVCEAFVDALAARGCMITRIPADPHKE